MRGRAELAQNENDFSSLKRAFELKMEEKQNLVKRSEVESIRNRDISNALSKVEHQKGQTEQELHVRKREEEDYRLINGKLCSNMYDLRAELEALRVHCNVLAG